MVEKGRTGAVHKMAVSAQTCSGYLSKQRGVFSHRAQVSSKTSDGGSTGRTERKVAERKHVVSGAVARG